MKVRSPCREELFDAIVACAHFLVFRTIDELLKRPFEGILLFIQALPLENLEEDALLNQALAFHKQIRQAKWQESIFALLA